MKVHIEQGAAVLMPYSALEPKLAMAMADKASVKTEEGAYYYTYHCTAENGIKKDVIDFASLPEGDYELPDKDWCIPEEVGISEEEMLYA